MLPTETTLTRQQIEELLNKEGLQPQYREFQILKMVRVVTAPAADQKQEEERFDIAISSEYPVQRWWGTEILDHSKDAVDLSRAKRGLSFLVEHSSRDMAGVVEDVTLDADKTLRGTVRFSRSAQAQSVKQDIVDGIRRFISVGYRIQELVLEKDSEEEGPTYRATRWLPLEASSVAVPADPTVGHNRDEGGRHYAVKFNRSEIQAAAKPTTEVVPVTTQPEVLQTQVNEARSTAAEIIRLGARHKIDQETTTEFVANGKSVAEFTKLCLDKIEERGGKPLPQPPAEATRQLTLTEKEQRQYNLARGIMALATNREYSLAGSSKRDNCFEMEVSDTLAKTWTAMRHGGLIVPWSLQTGLTAEMRQALGLPEAQARASNATALVTATSTKGAELIFTEQADFLAYLYNRMRVVELGARTLSGLRENLSFPKQSGTVSGSWVAENPSSPVTESALALAQVPSTPKTYQSSTVYSRQLLNQAVISIDALVREDLGMNMAQALDIAAINGPGTLAPTGILQASGVQSYTPIADSGNGGAISWDDCVIMTQKLEDVNADQLGEGAWLTTPPCKSKLKRIARLANTIGLPIWVDDNTVDGYMARSSNNVPKNLTKGTGTNLSALIRGIFQTMIIGMWGNGFELIVDPYGQKKNALIELTTFMQADVVLTYPEAFVVAKSVITT